MHLRTVQCEFAPKSFEAVAASLVRPLRIFLIEKVSTFLIPPSLSFLSLHFFRKEQCVFLMYLQISKWH